MTRPYIHKLYWAMFAGIALVLALVFAWWIRTAWAALPPGGFLESDTTVPSRQRMDAGDLAGFIPALKGAFDFPAPYSTRGIRITDDTDCPGGMPDCIWYVGYSYWMNINAHTHSEVMRIFLGTKDGTGVALFSYNKRTETVTRDGPMFSGGFWPLYTGEGWYWSADPYKPNIVYIYAQLHEGAILYRYNVSTQAFEVVVDITRQFGANRIIDQVHSSLDDKIHSMTILDSSSGGSSKNAWPKLGCAVYNENSLSWKWYPKLGTFDECHLEKLGRWTVSLEQLGTPGDISMRIFDNATGTEVRVMGPCGTLGHMDTGVGYMVGIDNNCPGETQPNAVRMWALNPAPVQGPVFAYSYDWNVNHFMHPSHQNSKPNIPGAWQVVCGSNATVTYSVADEIRCARIDTSYVHLVVAPVMTDPAAAGGGNDYAKAPKGNLDITGQYFIWTTNLGGARLDAFMVKVPTQLLQPSGTTTPPTRPTAPIVTPTP